MGGEETPPVVTTNVGTQPISTRGVAIETVVSVANVYRRLWVEIVLCTVKKPLQQEADFNFKGCWCWWQVGVILQQGIVYRQASATPVVIRLDANNSATLATRRFTGLVKAI